MSQSDIVTAVFGHAEDMVIGSPALPIFFEGVAVKPPTVPKYLWVRLVPNDTERPTVSFDQGYVWQGIIAINVVWSNGVGLLPPTKAAEDVAAHWVDGLRLEQPPIVVEINRPPSIRPAVQDGASMYVPVAIEYRAVARG